MKMKISKSKRMKNNASSAVNENETIKAVINTNSQENNDSKELISKHSGLRKTYLKRSKSPQKDINLTESHLNDGDKIFDERKPNFSSNQIESKLTIINTKFTINRDIFKIMMKLNFPTRYPVKAENQESESTVLVGEPGDKPVLISTTENQMKDSFIKFWNRLITKQDIKTRSILNHQLTEKEAGFLSCKLKTLFNSPESYLKKSFCEKIKYNGPGCQILSTPNQFCKSSKRSQIKLEVNEIFAHYSNPGNQYFLIPIEFTSKLSRSMLKSVEIAQTNLACNKINFVCNPQNLIDQITHPLLSVEYKSSIEEEILPSSDLNLMSNYPIINLPNTESINLLKPLINHPFLSYFLQRKDFSIDNFYARCWHYARYFCNKLDLGIRINNIVAIFIKDAIFKYLLACSVRICLSIKYWVLNPEGATYFRCRCGQKVFDVKQESKMLKKYPIGSVLLFKYQQKIQEQETYHRKHGDKKSNIHICSCNEQFKDHQAWYNHILSPKISEINKICPIVLFNLSNSCQDQNGYICECKDSFSDYDFWNFWIHICNCKVYKNYVKDNCHCSEKSKEIRSNSNMKSQELPQKRVKLIRKRKRSNSNSIIGDSKINSAKKERKSFDNEINKGKKKSTKSSKKWTLKINENQCTNEPNCQTGDNINLPLKLSTQINSDPNPLSKSKFSKRKSIENI